jgi:predicted nucleotide-binding protein (sugar kinase/HSP70/actin superfamily)
MEYGVSSKRMLTPSWWVKDMLLSPLGINSRDIHRASKDYIPLCIGGHAVECVGEAVLAADDGFDGAIQIFPMGCMPEIVSKTILSKISRDKDFPIMTLIVDEMTGEAGYITRVEAFLDLLERRRKENVLSWS